MAAPMVGENSIGMRLGCRSFEAVIRHSAFSNTLGIGRTAPGRFLLCGLATLIFQLAAVEAHGAIRVARSRSPLH